MEQEKQKIKHVYMKLVRLPKEFIYTNKSTLDEFLRGDDLNKELYKVYLNVKDRPYYFKFEVEDAFNEAWYIATIVMNDPHPELILKDLWYTAKGDIGWAYAANLVMSMVYAIISLQVEKPETINYVLMLMEGASYGEDHFPFFKAMVENTKIKYKSDFTIRPQPLKETENKNVNYRFLTEEYDQQCIRDIVMLFPSKEEKLALIDRIERYQENEQRISGEDDDLPF